MESMTGEWGFHISVAITVGKNNIMGAVHNERCSRKLLSLGVAIVYCRTRKPETIAGTFYGCVLERSSAFYKIG
jgi:hypothetical protein